MWEGDTHIAFWLLSLYRIFVVSCDRRGKELTEDVRHRLVLIMNMGLLSASMSHVTAHVEM